MQLIIVESPSKAKTIEKYLGGKYKVDASGGHVRDLPEKRIGVNINKNFEATYEISPDKKQVIKRLSEKAAKADKIYLATDPDREGEAISWHLREALKLDKDKTFRIEFNEISEQAVKNALEHPRDINMNLVDSQQARRVLDRLVGYKLSPLLCKRIKPSLSAGRVQSVVLRLIVDREREIAAFVPQEYWNINATLTGDKPPKFKALLQLKPADKAKADKVLSEINGADFIVKDVKKSVVSQHALPPFTTSMLQQDASNKFSMTSPQVMKLAQDLYEGIETPEGHIALITYIRTDSTRVSKAAQQSALEYIRNKFGDEYVPAKPNIYKAKKNSQDAHEAIRPIDLSRTPESVKKILSRNHYNLYKLIYERFIASQMADAKYNGVHIEIDANGYVFKTSGRTVLFNGYTAVYADYKKDDDDQSGDGVVLPNLEKGDKLNLVSLDPEQKFTKPPMRYTDASLVKAMEDKGIGRPSTYASIISVLSKRKYTVKDGKFIVPTEVAYQMTDMLMKYFSDIMDVSFTAKMEDSLDEIEEGGKDWHKLIADFYPPFAEKLAFATRDGDEVTDIVCEKCGSLMIRKSGRYGKFLKCSNSECDNIRSENQEVSDVKCEKCGENMIIKTGKYGKFLACPNYPKCSNIKPLDEVKSDEKCEKCGSTMSIKTGKFGKYLFCPECKNTKSMTVKAGVCPECGNPTQIMTSKKGKTFYGCSNYPDCSFMSWDMPTGEKCPKCGNYLVVTKDGKNIKCSNKDCDYHTENDKK
ncbi:MAG: type I DNA topoisomerase [Candidatus Borkfalkiaceae bacterium]|nr:type I DNA topoisomerase [Christensenellaceae bacterium]